MLWEEVYICISGSSSCDRHFIIVEEYFLTHSITYHRKIELPGDQINTKKIDYTITVGSGSTEVDL